MASLCLSSLTHTHTHTLSLSLPVAIYECEKTFERIFLGALFGPHAPHFIAGWRSDFQDQVSQMIKPLPHVFHMEMKINRKCLLVCCSAARECARHGLLSEACHTRTTHAARLDTALRGGASAQVSLTTTRLNLWPQSTIPSVFCCCECPKMCASTLTTYVTRLRDVVACSTGGQGMFISSN